MGSDHHVARNFAALGGGEAVSRVIAFAATVYLGRILGANGYGVVALAAGVTLYLAKVADFAIDQVGAHEVARGGTGGERVIPAVLAVRLAVTLALVALAVTGALFLLPDPERTVLPLYFLTLIPIALSTKWVHLGRGNARPIGLTRVVGECVALALIVIAVRGPRQLWLVPIAALLGESIPALLLYLGLARTGVRGGLRWDLATVLPIFARAAPLLAQLLLGLVLYNSELIFLRLLADGPSVGFYAAAYTLISFLASLSTAYGMSLLPALSRLGNDRSAERGLYHTAIAHAFAVCLPVSIGGFFLAPAIIQTTFGAAYGPAAPVLQVLMWAVPATTIRIVPWAALIARSEQRLLLRATAYTVVANVVFNLTLISFLGMTGAAVSTVLTESLVGVLMFAYAASDGLPFLAVTRLLRPLPAGVAMALVLAAVRSQPLPVVVALGALAYVLALVPLGVIRLRRGGVPALNL